MTQEEVLFKHSHVPQVFGDIDKDETAEWLEALQSVLTARGEERLRFLLAELLRTSYLKGVRVPLIANTPYINTIPAAKQPPYPGDRKIERRIKSLIRWNAMAMVVKANKKFEGLGGHISTYASTATLFEVAFNHFLRAKDENFNGDIVYFQGHATPGIYARAFLEGRISVEQMEHFRREVEKKGLSSYPHPWLMPDFWEVPAVSMGLAPISAIYQARFAHYLQDRGIKNTEKKRIWAFIGDGETDEPETLGSITLASREQLDNLIFVINCNLQRLDGPVRGNGNIIQELERIFRGAGWNVIKVIWGADWDPIFERDEDHNLIVRNEKMVDGYLQKYLVEPGSYLRQHYFGESPELLKLVEDLSDEELKKLRLGGHDPEKVYAAYQAAVNNEGSPTVILARTIKGYGLGEAGEGKNITHQQKKLNEDEMRHFRDRFDIPIPGKKFAEAPFYRPPDDSEEIQYLMDTRSKLGGFVPQRKVLTTPFEVPKKDFFNEFYQGTDRQVSTTMAFVRMLGMLMKEPDIGKRVVPIIPDEARTFGMESLFRQFGIYSHVGQLYEPVDSDTLLYYREDTSGQILEEGITEAGSFCSFNAAGTSYANFGIDTIPFFIFYSMFGFQRIGDLIWAFGDQRGRGFLIGATSGRTTLLGEGLQHQDGHSHVLASTVPNCISYDPTWAYEIAIILQNGLERMFTNREDIFYYLTVGNENYTMAKMPKGCEEGIIKGLYKFSESPKSKTGGSLNKSSRRPGQKGQKKQQPNAHIFGSGTILREALRAQKILSDKYNVSADVWSATSYNQLRRDALEVERWNMLHPDKTPKKPYVQKILEKEDGPFVAATDFMKIVPEQISRWVPGGLFALGTDGFGRSDTREALRRFFEVDAECITVAVLHQLVRRGKIKKDVAKKAIKDLGVDPEKAEPIIS